jgi:hypothetical protein
LQNRHRGSAHDERSGAGATQFFILRSAGGTSSVRWGLDTMQMAIGDYNGDGKFRHRRGGGAKRAALLVCHRLDNTVIVNGTQFGLAGDLVTVGDYDGDWAI